MFHFRDLNEETRRLMLEEIESDAQTNTVYFGRRLTENGIRDWPALLRETAQQHTPEWLTQQLKTSGRIKATESSHYKGRQIIKDVPWNAAEMLAEGEFNRFYIRAICLTALANGFASVIAYRAKAVSVPRSESVKAIGTSIDAQKLLEDLRTNQGKNTIYGLPGGP